MSPVVSHPQKRMLASYALAAVLTSAPGVALAVAGTLPPPIPATPMHELPLPSTQQASAQALEGEDETIEAAVREIEGIANEVANGRSFFEEDYRPIVIRASFDRAQGVVYLDTDERLGPEAGYTELVDLGRAIDGRIEAITENLPGFRWREFRMGGHDTDWWMDKENEGGGSVTPSTRRYRRDAAAKEQGPVLVAGGHGFYYHYGQKRWTSHRDATNGVLEDEITQVMVENLQGYLALKRVATENIRRMKQGSPHEPSGLEWWKLGARYHLEATRPDLKHIWNNKPGSTQVDRERREDIRSRPLYANHLNSPAVLHVHTNADENQGVSGTRTYVTPGRADDERLANSVLCGMRELIHSVPDFAGYAVASSTHFEKDHAENNLANMPSVITEVGFHTNPGDAKYLTNPQFQRAAMAGVAKGYRLYRDGKACAPFTIGSDKSLDVIVWGRGKLPLDPGGNPDYPINVTTKRVNCDSCNPQKHSIWDVAEMARFRIEHGCRPEDLDRSPIRYEVNAKDSFGVPSNTVTYAFACKPRPSRAAGLRAAR